MPSKRTVVLLSLLLATPVFIFCLWLLIVPARVAEPCPKECKCGTEGVEIFCYNSSLTAIPLIRFPNVRNLRLHNSNITLLEKDSFLPRGLSQLGILFIDNCGLRTIELGAFNGLPKLTKLSMQNNEISEITPGTFRNLNSLEALDLNNNKLEHCDSAVFSGLVNLKVIYLNGNKLQYLHPDAFVGLPKLQTLHLSNNPTLHIPSDRNFIHSHFLIELWLSRCNISSLSPETFANVSALERLELGDNNLRTVDINILRALPKLSILGLNYNPLQCDCQLKEVWRWCEDRNLLTWLVQCDTPSEVKGKRWGVLEELQCLEGNTQYYGDCKNTSCNKNVITVPITHNHTDQNTDTKQQQFFPRFLKQYQVPVYAVPFIFGTVSNVILLIIIICNKDMRTVPNMYIINLATSNIIYLTVLFSDVGANRISDSWLKGDVMCTFLPFCRRMSVGLSTYSLALYVFQLYRITVIPFQARVSSPPTWRVTVATICGVWIVAALFAIPSALSKYQCEEFAVLIHITYLQLLVIFELLVSCVLPVFVIAFTYITTSRYLVGISHFISEGTQNHQLKTRRNTAKNVLGLTVVFVISYVPYHAFWTYVICTWQGRIFSEKFTEFLIYSDYKLRYTYQISTCLLLINSCLNPVTLFCTSSPFRQHLKRYLTCFCKTNSPPTDLELATRH